MKIKNFFIVFLGLTTCFFCLATSSFPQEKASFQGTITKVGEVFHVGEAGRIVGRDVFFFLDNQPKKKFLIPRKDFKKYKLKIPTNYSEGIDAARKELVGKKVSLECLKINNPSLTKKEEKIKIEHYEVTDLNF